MPHTHSPSNRAVLTLEDGSEGLSLPRQLVRDLSLCLVVAILLTVIMAPSFSTEPGGWPDYLLVNSIISISIGMTLSSSLRLSCSLMERLEGPRGRLAAYALFALLGTALGAEIGVRIVDLLASMPAAELRPTVYRIGFAVAATVLAIRIGYNRLRDQARRDELGAQEAKKEALQARLKELQARTNPHFLFNSLNTAASLIEDDPVLAERTLEGLSDLFRYTLRRSQVEWVRLAEEIEAVEAYLRVEQLRFGERLRYEIEIPSSLEGALIPPLILQPLVENAILHGIASRRGGGTVTLHAVRTDDSLRFRVADDGDGPGRSNHRGSRTSLEDLEKRLALIYNGDALLTTGAAGEDGTGFVATIVIPMPAGAPQGVSQGASP